MIGFSLMELVFLVGGFGSLALPPIPGIGMPIYVLLYRLAVGIH